MLVRSFAKNTKGRDFAVGDVHGAFSKLNKALALLGFDREVDRLFSVGDLVDRGPESPDCLEWLAEPWFFAVRGNHEDMTISHILNQEAAQIHVSNGGSWFKNFTPIGQKMFIDAFNQLPLLIEVETDNGLIGIVHADLPGNDWEHAKNRVMNPSSGFLVDHSHEVCLWSRARIKSMNTSNILGVHALILGHTVIANPVVLGNAHFIETQGWADGAFTFMELSSLKKTVINS